MIDRKVHSGFVRPPAEPNADDIKASVNEFLETNPVTPGASAEEAAQIKLNAENIEKLQTLSEGLDTVVISDSAPNTDNKCLWIQSGQYESFDLPQINDETVSEEDTWSSKKISDELNAQVSQLSEENAELKGDLAELEYKTDAFADFYQTSENILDNSTIENGKFIQSDGSIVNNSTYALTDYISVKNGWTIYGYIAPNTITALGSWFDSNKVRGGQIESLDGYELTNSSKRYFTLKVNFDGYIRMNIYANAPYQNVMVKLNTTIDTSLSEPLCKNHVPYEEPYWKIGIIRATSKWDASFIERNNIFIPTKSVSGYLNPDGTGVWSNTNYKTSEYIPIEASTKYVIQGITTRFCLYDANKTPIASTYNNEDVANREFTNDTYSFVRFTYFATEEERMYVRKESEGFFDTFMKHSYINRENPLLGKKLLALGDSIMEGNGNENFGLGDIIASRNSMYLKDVSKGGATIGYMASRDGLQTLIQHQKDMAIASDFEPDYIIIDGQTNDIDKASSTPQTDKITLGEVTDAYDSEFVNTSFAGGLEIIFRDLKAKYPTAKMVYVRVHHMGSRSLASQNTYGNIAKTVCEKWSVPIADIYNNGTMNTFLDEYVQYTGNEDKTHPNRRGYDNFYIPIIESTLSYN